MRLKPANSRFARRTEAAFTIVEIALSIGILAVALVAIIGVLPTGLQVQKDNREETLINQDATFLLEAIRSGSQGIHDLTNYVDSITVSNLTTATSATYSGARLDGRSVIGLLTTPRYVYTGVGNNRVTQRVTAKMRAISGSAVDKSRQMRDIAFNYFLLSEIIPFEAYPPALTNFSAGGLSAEVAFARSNRWMMAGRLAARAYQLRLTFEWPLFPNGTVGNGRQSFRTLVVSRPIFPPVQTNNLSLYFFQP